MKENAFEGPLARAIQFLPQAAGIPSFTATLGLPFCVSLSSQALPL
jgi:hypothetical protein